jgi:uncharacterized membrane protein YvlD (DUF360 family)
MNYNQFIIEPIVIGLMTALLLWILTRFIRPDTTVKILVLGFLVGAIFHFIMEALGMNMKYCKYRISK